MKTNTIPEKLPCVLMDLVVEGMGSFGEMMIQLELEFDRQLDRERLARAFDLLLDYQPVLGCRREWENNQPFWRRLNGDGRSNFTVVENEADYEIFAVKPMDIAVGPLVQGCLVGSADGDKLLLKVAHQISDAGGVKEISGYLSEIYRRLETEPNYIPETNINGSRAAFQILRLVSPFYYPRIYLNFLREVGQAIFPGPHYRMPMNGDQRDAPKYIRYDISRERIEAAAEFGRRKGSTLNDILLAAYFRSIAEQGLWDGNSHFRAAFTIDLRKYLPSKRGEGIANLSALEWFRYGNELGSNIEDTMMSVTRQMRWRKRSWFGFNALIGVMPILAVLPKATMLKAAHSMMHVLKNYWSSNLALTNMGPISDNDVDYGVKPQIARLLVPPMYTPIFGAGISGYAGGITLTAGVYSADNGYAKDILAGMEQELPG
jgi:NRPS condensation-like uncharacterized protein